MHSIVTTFRGGESYFYFFFGFKKNILKKKVIKVEVENFCAAMDTLIDQDGLHPEDSSL